MGRGDMGRGNRRRGDRRRGDMGRGTGQGEGPMKRPMGNVPNPGKMCIAQISLRLQAKR